jgi:GDPmannose 4,6-dehydratase
VPRKKKKKRALITGITGQDGSYLAEFLLNKDYEVSGIIRKTSHFRYENIAHVQDSLNLVQADLLDAVSLVHAFKTIGEVDEVYNLASQSAPGESFRQPIHTAEITAIGAQRVIETVHDFYPKAKVYQASSSEMFGWVKKVPQNEQTPFNPANPYAAAKLYAHNIAQIYKKSYGMFIACGILFNHECVSENTPVIIRDKFYKLITIKRVSDIKKAKSKGKNVQQWEIGDLEIWDGENFVALNFITATKRKDNNSDHKCKIINSRHGLLNASNHHNMLNSKGGKIKAKNVRKGVKLMHKKFPQSPNATILTVEEAEFLGMMVGDGYVSEEGRGNFSNNIVEIRRRFSDLWLKISLGKVKPQQYKTEYGHTDRLILSGNRSYLRMIKKEIYAGKYKKVPDRVLNSGKKAQLAFLRGYNCTDGLASNPCTYEFKCFKTNSDILLQGLLFLISQTTKQDFNVTYEEDDDYYGYYSANLLSPTNSGVKERKVKKYIEKDMSQREISVMTGVSRTFIRKIQQGGSAEIVHHFSKNKEEVKKTLYHNIQPKWLYDLETTSGKFMAGVGTIVVSNSPRRGLGFVTQKVTYAAACAKLKIKTSEHLNEEGEPIVKKGKVAMGNLKAQRDWGFAGDYVESMWLMLQQAKPDDFVIGTGETHTIEDLCKEAFAYVGKNWKGYVTVDKRFIRPTETGPLVADYSKAKKKLHWKPKTNFKELVAMLVDANLARLK